MNYSQQALHFRLRALSCPLDPLPSLNDATQLQTLIAWLEDTHIRRLPIPNRTPLYQRTAFLQPLQNYLRTLKAPAQVIPHTPRTSSNTPTPVQPNYLHAPVAWLVDLALNLHYTDHADVYNTPVDPWHGRCIPVVDSIAKAPCVAKGLNDVLKALHMPEEFQREGTKPSPVEAAQIAADAVRCLTRAHDDGDDAADAAVVDLDQVPLGFETGDAVVDRVAKVLRLLHLRQLRSLQGEINDVLADMQALTANPKTNSKLGKVGW